MEETPFDPWVRKIPWRRKWCYTSHLRPQRKGQKKLSYTVGGKVSWCSHYGEQYVVVPWKKLKTELPYDPVIPFLGTYTEKMKRLTWKDTCTLMFIAALFTIAEIWKQIKCPSTGEWIKKMWYIWEYIYKRILLNHNKEWNNAVYSNMDGHTKWTKSVRQRKTSCDVT